MNLIGFHREQHLASAAKLAEAGEDESDHLLEAQVRIESEPGLRCQIHPDGTDSRSSSRTALDWAASIIRARNAPSSNSLT